MVQPQATTTYDLSAARVAIVVNQSYGNGCHASQLDKSLDMYLGISDSAYLPDLQSQAVLVRTSSSTYEKRFPDGSKQVYCQSDGSASYPRKIFMTQWVDPSGNAVTITYDSSFRITTITDALGQVTTLSYE